MPAGWPGDVQFLTATFSLFACPIRGGSCIPRGRDASALLLTVNANLVAVQLQRMLLHNTHRIPEQKPFQSRKQEHE